MTSLWKITKKHTGGSYDIEHQLTNVTGKQHAEHLSPMPPELIPFLPVDGDDTQYGQIYQNTSNKAYNAAQIDGFMSQPPLKRVLLFVPTQDTPN